jgi:hypothetical protein
MTGARTGEHFDFLFFWKHNSMPNLTSHWHPKVKLIARGPFTSFNCTPLGLNPSRAQNELHQRAIIPWEFYLVLRKKLNTIAV